MPKRNVVIAFITRTVVCLLLLAASLAVFSLLVSTRPVPAPSEQAAAAPRVLVMRAQAVPVRRQFDGFGTAKAMDSADVPARVTATVDEVPPEILSGARVVAGQLLARLDATDFAEEVEISTQAIADINAQLDRMEIEQQSWKERAKLATDDVELAQAEFDRVQRALDREAARPREVDQAKQALIRARRIEVEAIEELDKLLPRSNSLKAQRAGLVAAQRRATQSLERCEIRSPIDGVLQGVDVEVGENLASGQRVARVVSLRRVEVPLQLPASARAEIAEGDEVELRSTGAADLTWSGRIARIAPEEDELTRTFSVFVDIEQDPSDRALLTPGKFVRGTVISRRSEMRSVVPRRAVGSGRILLVEDGRIASRRIAVDFQLQTTFPQLGLPDSDWAVLRDTLPDGSLVVVTESRSLADGVRVTPFFSASSPVAGMLGAEAAP